MVANCHQNAPGPPKVPGLFVSAATPPTFPTPTHSEPVRKDEREGLIGGIMLGFAPLASIALASAPPLVAVAEHPTATGGITFSGSSLVKAITPASATGGITFSGTVNLGLFTPLAATGPTIIFSGTAYAYAEVHAASSGGITFNGHPTLRVAGKPIVITALPNNFTIRVVMEDFTMTALPMSFTVRGKPE